MRKYIENKICKTFVDYCLLENVEEVYKYTKFDKFKELNPFEKVLLVYTLREKKEYFNDAKSIVEML